MKKAFLLINGDDGTMIDEFESHSDFPIERIKESISLFWSDVSDVILNPYKSDLSVLTNGTAVSPDGDINFILVNTSGNEI